jgi:hypothetical protein
MKSVDGLVTAGRVARAETPLLEAVGEGFGAKTVDLFAQNRWF